MHRRERPATEMTADVPPTGYKGKVLSPRRGTENEKVDEKEAVGDRQKDLSQAPSNRVH